MFGLEDELRDETRALKKERDRLLKVVELYEELIIKLTTTEYLAYTRGSSASDHQYKMGATDGHRLTAEWAKEAKQKAKEIMGAEDD